MKSLYCAIQLVLKLLIASSICGVLSFHPQTAQAGQAATGTMVSPSPGGALKNQITVTETHNDEYKGGLDIRIHPEVSKLEPSADLLLTDPEGRKTGADPRDKTTYKDIPVSFYEFESLDDDETGEPGPASGVIDVGNPVDGVYILRVTGIEDGRYSLELNGYNKKYDASHVEALDIPIKKGEVVEYRFRYSRTEVTALVLNTK